MTVETDIFVEEARRVKILEAAARLNLAFTRGRAEEHPGPCPVCGGTDTFSFNTKKNAWNCRAGGAGGRDAIGLAGHVLELDLSRRPTFIAACAAVLGRDAPDEAEREDEATRRERLARLDRLRLEHYEAMAAEQSVADDFRERERQKARGIYGGSALLVALADSPAHAQLRARGCELPDARWLRFSADQTYWHGKDDRDRPLALWTGPAMVAPFVDRDWAIVGCHITWIDLACPPKCRPVLFGLTKKGAGFELPEWRVGDPPPSPVHLDHEIYERLPTKKMRGSKKGGLIPLAGEPAARRWAGGEGIENTLAFAGLEGFRDDTFYFAAGDLGNLVGPADPKSRFPHPTLTKVDKRGVGRPVMIAGAIPLFRAGEAEAVPVADHVDELLLLGDADSERVMTAAAMARGRARYRRDGRRILVLWPRRGMDFSELALELQTR